MFRTGTILVLQLVLTSFETTAVGRRFVIAKRYHHMLREKVFSIVSARTDARQIWLQQEGIQPIEPTKFLWTWKENLVRVINRRKSITWSTQSHDLNPLDFWIWGFSTQTVYRRNYLDNPELQ